MTKHFNTKHCKSKISHNSQNNFFIIPDNINKIITKVLKSTNGVVEIQFNNEKHQKH